MIIRKVLVANRAEIAVRVMRTCRELGISTVAVYSEADRAAMHVRHAKEAYCIGPAPSRESYLDIEKIIEVAKKAKVDAIHPGYGFLSENAAFADRCREEGIIFIGPSSYSISTMGDKITARRTMIDAGVKVVPGTKEKFTDDEAAFGIIKQIGLPVMIKASAGGGGKGMRLVRTEADIEPSIRRAKSEALSAFGDNSVYIEKYIESPHHIEFQILADQHGNVIHLGERDCSVQRRHQKVVEETPSTLLTPKVRKEMGEEAIAAAKAVNYYGAGTIEFLVDDNLNYYFLEMNTRLQVEHPITERVTGLDLVKEQIFIAEGKELQYKQEDIRHHGHAIECRIYAEDPENNFRPSPGIIKHITEPLGFGVRCDGHAYEGYEIPIYYDPLITKLISWAPTREEAINRMKRALHEYKITGIKTNIAFLERIIEAEDFVQGKYDTNFIEKNKEFLMTRLPQDQHIEDIALITAFIDYQKKLDSAADSGQKNESINKWKSYSRKTGIQRI
jgi:acetyl-CoA carboxylase, biotin carboxylase subunit